MTQKKVRALVADDHPLCREATRLALEAVIPEIEIDEAATLFDVLDRAAGYDIIVLDICLPDSRGFTSLIETARVHAGTPVLVLSALESPSAEGVASSLGATGFVAKSAPIAALVHAVAKILAGGRAFSSGKDFLGSTEIIEDRRGRLAALTPAESRVLRAMSDGRLNKQIAHDLGLSEMTVKQHIRAILRKLEVFNRTQAVLLMREPLP